MLSILGGENENTANLAKLELSLAKILLILYTMFCLQCPRSADALYSDQSGRICRLSFFSKRSAGYNFFLKGLQVIIQDPQVIIGWETGQTNRMQLYNFRCTPKISLYHWSISVTLHPLKAFWSLLTIFEKYLIAKGTHLHFAMPFLKYFLVLHSR